MRCKRTSNYPHGVMVGTCAHMACWRPRRSHQLCETHARYLREGRSIAYPTHPRNIPPADKRPADPPKQSEPLTTRTVERLLWMGWSIDRIATNHDLTTDALTAWLARAGRDDLLRKDAA